MKKFTVQKGLIIAAAISIMIIGTAAIATNGTVRVITGSSSSIPTYKEIPTEQTLQKDIGITPKILPEFSNGYAFKSAVKINNKVQDIIDSKTFVVVTDEDGNKKEYKSISIRYVNGDDELTIAADPVSYTDENALEEAENYKGVSISYAAFSNKFVPANYQQTAQDIIDEEEGKYVFSYGTDDIQIIEVQGVTWVQDGIKYHINAMDSTLDKQELIDMAKEVIDF